MPDGFIVLDRDGIVKRANRAFLDLVQAGADGAVLGQSLQRWLAVPGADLGALLTNVRKHGEVRLFPTTIRGELGTDLQVELSAAGDVPAGAAYIGVLIRDVSRRLPASDQDRMNQMIGAFRPYNPNVPLKKVIQDIVGLVEREYVEAALAQTNGNRAAAAELLGMSRQSLYAKLDRYGLDGDTKEL
jgi:transcriptional regulator PpsR